METLVANLKSKAEKRTLYGRDYLVAPATLIVPGVLNGSKGPLYYPPEEVARHPEVWNHKPITLNHPESPWANNPDLLNRIYLGFIMNTRVENAKLVADLWFDIYRVMAVDNRILNRLTKGEVIELSTGLGIEAEPVANESEYNGVRYTAVAKNFRPDHLAVLLDTVGACSVRDGCGILINELVEILNQRTPEEISEITTLLSPKGEETMATKALVDDLIQNCSCWTETDREALNAMSDEKVKGFLDAAKKAKENEAVANAAKRGFEGEEGAYVYNEQTKQMEFKKKETPPATPPSVPPVTNGESTTTVTVTKADIQNAMKGLSPEEWYDLAPAEVRSTHKEQLRIVNEEKGKLVLRLVENAEESDKEAVRNYWNGQPIESVRIAVKSLPKKSDDNPYRSDYSGMAPAHNSSGVENVSKPDPLGVPDWDFEEIAQSNR